MNITGIRIEGLTSAKSKYRTIGFSHTHVASDSRNLKQNGGFNKNMRIFDFPEIINYSIRHFILLCKLFIINYLSVSWHYLELQCLRNWPSSRWSTTHSKL